LSFYPLKRRCAVYTIEKIGLIRKLGRGCFVFLESSRKKTLRGVRIMIEKIMYGIEIDGNIIILGFVDTEGDFFNLR